MLPPGLAAHLADRTDQQLLGRLLPAARTVVRLVVGDCACDLVRPRHADPREDERQHRHRWRKAGGLRADLLAVIERHRRGGSVPAPAGGWPRALAAFVAEHARNAGDTLYLLRFTDAPATAATLDPPVRRLRAAQVVADPGAWLEEQVPVLVVP
jgi:hypothetical protein